MEHDLEDLKTIVKNGSAAGSDTGSTAPPVNVYNSRATTPIAKRTTVEVGNIPRDTTKEDLKFIKDAFSYHSSINEIYSPGKFLSFVEVGFPSSSKMWESIKDYKSKPL